ncbi:MAG: Carnitinyl-CoA dehydratase [Smithella sp. PtaU1.Bin162]|nr:MAG: Carnitinyl-CoA dehydratase [Smithella sp. PtaU1.Bin162]
MNSTVLIETKGHVFEIKMNLPGTMNSLEKNLRTDLKNALRQFRDSTEGRVAILTGQGKAFCSGGSLLELKDGLDASAAVNYMQDANEIIKLIVGCGKPIIAAVNGAAVGAGFNIALACDMVVASTNAVFGQAFAKVGLVPDLGGLYFLPRVVGMHRAKELILTARMVKAEEALQMGIVNRLMTPEELETRVLNMAKDIAEGPAVAYGLGKIILAKTWENNLDDVLQYEAFAQALCMQTADHKEGVKAFYEKRKPEFNGK